jgi:ABC-type nitrate/sulfonate/bicarbonate transport system substrate-binding protein
VLLMADYGVNLYGNTIMVNPKFAAEKPEAVKAFLRAFLKGLHETIKNPATSVESVLKRNGRCQEGCRARAPANRAEGQHRHARGEEERLRRRR